MPGILRNNILVIGGGSVGAIAAVNIELGGVSDVTLVLRSNYDVVNEKGYDIESCDHGNLKGWRPSKVRNTVPNVSEEGLPYYNYIVVATKNIPDISPTVIDLVSPALRIGNRTETTIVLLQNGLNIEKPFLTSFPDTIILSGVSLIGSAEPSPGHIVQDEPDRLLIGAFPHPSANVLIAEALAKSFVVMYSSGRKTDCTYSPNVLHDRWRKLVYNACLNPICTITGLDSGRIRLADGALNGLVRPAMREIVRAARAAAGVDLAGDVIETMINVDPLESYLKPSMQQDVEKGNYIEFENLLGEPLREGRRAGVEMPTLEVLYQLAKAVQWRIKERRGLVDIPT
ncbi:putative 2-dehydropantoate 2-reductase family protein [Dothidotthia symphoricarpi CBS 119687]|uniref:2-dehydropantoate 2-reductase n=1 Tax=Dothidotthia symphoricarpi CBS 119687 TaxID=1392245 RepID=A0A6A6AV31_9PLEO|nr:putative 2-dehydropantoate 2-reductase family protein [Dothidotthia symphoricarpi CBS 119687]KAF2134727.1 putative 2-dehydropantoate 2-reductase family protein [Dothidotthia symphoricarpi CBS 119687]